MNKPEYIKQQEIIKQTYGMPEWNGQGSPVNESAKRLIELRNAYNSSVQENIKNKKLEEKANVLKRNGKLLIQIPDGLIRNEWLVTFNDKQREIIAQWMKDVDQSPKEIADTLNTTVQAVKAVMSLEAFKMLRKHLAEAYKETLSLEAIAVLKDLLNSENESVRKDVAKTLLLDAGVLRAELQESPKKAEAVFDSETEEKLRKLGNDILGLSESVRQDGMGDEK